MVKMKGLIVWTIFFLVSFAYDAFAVDRDRIFAVGSVPFGEINSPINNSVVRGSMVKLGEGSFVEGVRPDIATAYSQYPYSNKAGWAFSLVTNFLPDGGNSSYTLRIVVKDND